jgi:hypothetical protein
VIQKSRISDEGVRNLLEDVPHIVHREKVEDLKQKITKYRTILIHTTLAIRKTSLLQQLDDNLMTTSFKHGILNMHYGYLHKEDEHLPDAVSFDKFFKTTFGKSWNELLSTSLDAEFYVLLVDKAQKIYTGYVTEFWNYIKAIAALLGKEGVCAVFFSMYRDTNQSSTMSARQGTPFTPNLALRVDYLQLSPVETKQLSQDFDQQTRIRYLPEIVPVIDTFTRDHARMIRALLEV